MSRRSQPYRRGSILRMPGTALTNMLRGKTVSGFNPKDLERNVQTMMRARKRANRPSRPDRPDRPPR